jgi:hypothetical protein
MRSLGWEHYVAKSMAEKFLKETSGTIWKVLSQKSLKRPTLENWLAIAEVFEQKWNLPNCIGVFDGKHIPIQAPRNAESLFFNYMKSHTIALMAVCNTEYNFTLVYNGAYGKNISCILYDRAK